MLFILIGGGSILKHTKSPYYNLDKIPLYRQKLIDKAVNEFKRQQAIKSMPIDCVQLAVRLNNSKTSNIKFKSTADLPQTTLAKTIYLREMDTYFISVNDNQLYDRIKCRDKYPFQYSSDRMLNFTLAHEIGHIMLCHTDIPDELKDDLTIEQEHLEADEFAGRLLMPQDSILSCSFHSLCPVPRLMDSINRW